MQFLIEITDNKSANYIISHRDLFNITYKILYDNDNNYT